MNTKPKKEISQKEWDKIYHLGYRDGIDDAYWKVKDFIDKKVGL